MKRRAETLIEVIIAMSVFGTIMIGTFDFMANQTLAMSKLRERDDIEFWAQKYINHKGGPEVEHLRNEKNKERVKIEHDGAFKDIEAFTIRKGSTTVTYRLK